MVKIAATVTFYNPTEETVKNIDSYIKDVEKIYIVDNSDCSNEFMLPKSKKIVYIPKCENIGVASALNEGANKAINDGFEWLLTMDQDSQFGENQLRKMIDYLGTIKKKDRIGLICPWHLIKTNLKKPKKKIQDVIEVMTSGNIINLNAFKEIGGYKDWLFIDGVDFDYCMNLNIHDYKVRRLNYIELEHELGDIKIRRILHRNIVCSNHNYLRRYYMARNNHYIYDMYHEYFPSYCKMITNGLKWQFRNIFVFEKDKYRKLRNMIRGYKDYKNGVVGKYPYKN